MEAEELEVMVVEKQSILFTVELWSLVCVGL